MSVLCGEQPGDRFARGSNGARSPGIGGGAAAAVAVVSLLIASSTNHPASQLPVPTVAAGSVARGQPPPDFTATTFDGGQLTLSALKGRPVLVNFFASWCTQCAHELPFMEQSYQRHQADGCGRLDGGRRLPHRI
jgi:thiol-disulfide isomerase/thioredoxin